MPDELDAQPDSSTTPPPSDPDPTPTDGGAADVAADAPPRTRSVRRRAAIVAAGGLAVAVLAVFANLSQVSGFSMRDIGTSEAAGPATRQPGAAPAGTSANPTIPGPTPTGPASTGPASTGPVAPAPSSPAGPGGAGTTGPVVGGATNNGVGNNGVVNNGVVINQGAGNAQQPAQPPAGGGGPASIAFGIDVPNQVPLCSDIGGPGSRPTNGRVLIFVRHSGQAEYFYEQPVDHPGTGRWVAHSVRVGEPLDRGQFYLHLVLVDQATADTIVATCVNTFCRYVDNPPGQILASSGPVTRTASNGSCVA
jgi:hypothetical protein